MLTFNGFWTMDLVSFKLVVWSQTVFTAILALGLEGARLRKVASWIRRSVHTKEKLARQPWPWKLPGKPAEFCSFWKLGQSFATWKQTCTGHPAKEGPGGGRERLVPGQAFCPAAGGVCAASEVGTWGRTGPRGEEPRLNPGSHQGSFTHGLLGLSLLPVSFHTQPPWNPVQVAFSSLHVAKD